MDERYAQHDCLPVDEKINHQQGDCAYPVHVRNYVHQGHWRFLTAIGFRDCFDAFSELDRAYAGSIHAHNADALLDGISTTVAIRTRDGVASIMSKSSCLRDGATHCD